MKLNKVQLLQAVINDLGDENRGLQVRGYNNQKILCNVIEALVALQSEIKKEESEVKQNDNTECD